MEASPFNIRIDSSASEPLCALQLHRSTHGPYKTHGQQFAATELIRSRHEAVSPAAPDASGAQHTSGTPPKKRDRKTIPYLLVHLNLPATVAAVHGSLRRQGSRPILLQLRRWSAAVAHRRRTIKEIIGKVIYTSLTNSLDHVYQIKSCTARD